MFLYKGWVVVKKIERDHKVKFLLSKTTLDNIHIYNMTDAEIDYYHWLYSDENEEAYTGVH